MSFIASLRRDQSLSAWVAGFIAVLVSYAGPLVIVFQAAQAAGLSTEMTSSWIWAISVGSGITGMWLSWKLRTPVVVAWSTPGAALLTVTLSEVSLAEAVGAYIFAAALITIIGVSGLFDRLIARIPKGIAAAMLAGILFRFGAGVFAAVPQAPALVLSMLATFFILKRMKPRYAVAGVMLVGMAVAIAEGGTNLMQVEFNLVQPTFITPQWSWHAMLGLGLPLALVTLTGQYVPGMAVLRTSGYQARAREIVGVTGLASLLLAPFGSHGINLAAITAAICTGAEAHEDGAKRYVAGLACGFIYVIIGCFGGALALLFASLPAELIAALAGLALLAAISGGLVGLAQDERHRDAGIVTFLTTASGVSFLGLGAAFWGLVLGGLVYLVLYKPWNRTAVVKASSAPKRLKAICANAQ